MHTKQIPWLLNKLIFILKHIRPTMECWGFFLDQWMKFDYFLLCTWHYLCAAAQWLKNKHSKVNSCTRQVRWASNKHSIIVHCMNKKSICLWCLFPWRLLNTHLTLHLFLQFPGQVSSAFKAAQLHRQCKVMHFDCSAKRPERHTCVTTVTVNML